MNAHIIRECAFNQSKTFGAVMLSMGCQYVVVVSSKRYEQVQSFMDFQSANMLFDVIEQGDGK